MRQLSTDEVSKISSLFEDIMFDEGSVDTYSESIGAIGGTDKSWSTGSSIKCGFTYKGGSKIYRNGYVIESENASVRLPAGTSVTKLDHFTLTKRQGIAVTPISFGIEGIDYGFGGQIILTLKALEV